MVAASAGMLLGFPAPGVCVTNEQLVFLEAWKAVDRAYIDKTFNGSTWFRVRRHNFSQSGVPVRYRRHAVVGGRVS